MAERVKAPPPPRGEEKPEPEKPDDLAAAKEAIADAMESLASAYGAIERLERD